MHDLLQETDLPITTDRNGHVIELGCTVRSYDFEWTQGPKPPDCYVEGVVEGCVEFPDCPRYKIRVTRTVVRGEETWHADTHVYPPLNGTQALFSGVANGVVVIEAPQPATADEALSAALAALKVITLDPANRKGIDPKALEQVEQALALIESYEADRDACLAERGDADLAGSREWDNEVRQ